MKMLDLSMESIAFQNPVFFRELTMVFEEVKKLNKKDVGDSELMGSLSAIIRHHTNMNITVGFSAFGPHLEVPPVNKNHILYQNYLRNHTSSTVGLAEIMKHGGPIRGSVNRIKNWVDGVYAEIPMTIQMPEEMLSGTKYVADELAGILLHEVGHGFTYFEYMDALVTTNHVLASLSKDLDGTNGVEDRENVLLTLKQVAKLPNLDATKLAKTDNRQIITAVVISNVAKASESELGRNIYDSTQWEALSDAYAARCQAGRQVVTALDKLYGGSFNISFRSLPTYLFVEALKLAMVVLNPFVLILLCAIDGNGDNTYDRPGARFTRIRSQIVTNLKDRDLSKEDVSRLEADIKIVDGILEHVNDRRQFFEVVWDSISPSARKDLAYTKMQQELEAIATNDLFARAAELKNLAI